MPAEYIEIKQEGKHEASLLSKEINTVSPKKDLQLALGSLHLDKLKHSAP